LFYYFLPKNFQIEDDVVGTCFFGFLSS